MNFVGSIRKMLTYLRDGLEPGSYMVGIGLVGAFEYIGRDLFGMLLSGLILAIGIGMIYQKQEKEVQR